MTEQRMISALTTYQWDTDKKRRFGDHHDGGYILAKLDPLDNQPHYDCYISAGVSSYDSVSHYIINEYGLTKAQCFAFDNTVDHYPHYPPTEITFFQKNISDTNDDKHTNLHDIVATHRHICLKMDIEGGEYRWLHGLTSEQLQSFRQIVIEFHGLYQDYDVRTESSDNSAQIKTECLEKLAQTHYIVHAHANNHEGYRIVDNQSILPNVIELTYIRKSDVGELPLNTVPFPLAGLDMPNQAHTPDIALDRHPFVH